MSEKTQYTEDEVQGILEKFRYGHPGESCEHNGTAQIIVNDDDRIVGIAIVRQVESGINYEKLVLKPARGGKSVKVAGWDDRGRDLVGKIKASLMEVVEMLEQSKSWPGGSRKIDPAPGETYPQAVTRVIATLDITDRDHLRELVAWVLDYGHRDRSPATAGTSPKGAP